MREISGARDRTMKPARDDENVNEKIVYPVCLRSASRARVLLSRPSGPTTLSFSYVHRRGPHYDCLRCAYLENAAHPTHGINAAHPAPGRTLVAELNGGHHDF